MTKIRKATDGDAEAITLAFLTSLRDVCAKDHTETELNAFASRASDEVRRNVDIRDQSVWVVEIDGKVEGFGHLHCSTVFGRKLAQVHGLYLTPAAIGRGLGKQIAQLLIDEAKNYGAAEIRLESTLTAHAFYRQLGFEYDGDPTTHYIGANPVRCIPMQMILGRNIQ